MYGAGTRWQFVRQSRVSHATGGDLVRLERVRDLLTELTTDGNFVHLGLVHQQKLAAVQCISRLVDFSYFFF